ncbi:hypothetical protein JXM67_04840 [candidate division WOR-3 bacterium]|nr:hypothetical protein [candidate division WOR-3 bacterium]
MIIGFVQLEIREKAMKTLNLVCWSLIQFSLTSCSLWPSGPSKPEIIISYDEMPLEKPIISNPQWGPEGEYIYLTCWNFDVAGFAICRSDSRGDYVEKIKTLDGSPIRCAVSPEGNKLAYWEFDTISAYSSDIVVFTDLDGNIIDTIHAYSPLTRGRFSTVSDTLFYLAVPHEGVRCYNLNTGEYELSFTHSAFPGVQRRDFDLFPGDTALVALDTVFSLTSNAKHVLPPKDCSQGYLTYSVNPSEPRYVALSGCGAPHLPKERHEEARNNDIIIIVDVIADTCTVLEATPRDRKDVEYWGVYYADFSPDGNSLVYYIYNNGVERDGNEIALITDIMDK